MIWGIKMSHIIQAALGGDFFLFGMTLCFVEICVFCVEKVQYRHN